MWFALKYYLGMIAFLFRNMTWFSPRKPYNPIQTEFFRCIWFNGASVNGSKQPYYGGYDRFRTASGFMPNGLIEGNREDYVFLSEKVQSNPDAVAFFAKCDALGLVMDGCIASKFKMQLGCPQFIKWISLKFTGRINLHLKKLDETYTMELPSLRSSHDTKYIRVDLRGSASIKCTKTNYRCNVTFLNPGRRMPRFAVTALMYSPDTKHPILKVQGLWNGAVKVVDSSVTTTGKTFQSARRIKNYLGYKVCTPIGEMEWRESRRLWRRLTMAIQQKDYKTAHFERNVIRDRQDAMEGPLFFRYDPMTLTYYFREDQTAVKDREVSEMTSFVM